MDPARFEPATKGLEGRRLGGLWGHLRGITPAAVLARHLGSLEEKAGRGGRRRATRGFGVAGSARPSDGACSGAVRSSFFRPAQSVDGAANGA